MKAVKKKVVNVEEFDRVGDKQCKRLQSEGEHQVAKKCVQMVLKSGDVTGDRNTADPQTAQRLEALTLHAIKNPSITFNSPQTLSTSSLLLTGSLTNNINT